MVINEVENYSLNVFIQYCEKYDVGFEGGGYALATARILNKIVGRSKYYTTTRSWCSSINDRDSNEEVFEFDLFKGYLEMLIQFIQKIELLHKLELLEK